MQTSCIRQYQGPIQPSLLLPLLVWLLAPSLLSFVLVSRLHLGQAPAVSAENPLVIYSHHSIVPTPSASVLATCESWESFSASEGKVSEASFTPATGPVTRAAVGGCWWRGPTSQQAHVVFFNLQDWWIYFLRDYHGNSACKVLLESLSGCRFHNAEESVMCYEELFPKNASRICPGTRMGWVSWNDKWLEDWSLKLTPEK